MYNRNYSETIRRRRFQAGEKRENPKKAGTARSYSPCERSLQTRRVIPKKCSKTRQKNNKQHAGCLTYPTPPHTQSLPSQGSTPAVAITLPPRGRNPCTDFSRNPSTDFSSIGEELRVPSCCLSPPPQAALRQKWTPRRITTRASPTCSPHHTPPLGETLCFSHHIPKAR